MFVYQRREIGRAQTCSKGLKGLSRTLSWSLVLICTYKVSPRYQWRPVISCFSLTPGNKIPAATKAGDGFPSNMIWNILVYNESSSFLLGLSLLSSTFVLPWKEIKLGFLIHEFFFFFWQSVTWKTHLKHLQSGRNHTLTSMGTELRRIPENAAAAEEKGFGLRNFNLSGLLCVSDFFSPWVLLV